MSDDARPKTSALRSGRWSCKIRKPPLRAPGLKNTIRHLEFRRELTGVGGGWRLNLLGGFYDLALSYWRVLLLNIWDTETGPAWSYNSNGWEVGKMLTKFQVDFWCFLALRWQFDHEVTIHHEDFWGDVLLLSALQPNMFDIWGLKLCIKITYSTHMCIDVI